MSKVKKSLKVKIISLGNSETGKSCIIKRYCEKRFVQKYLQTIGIDYGVTKVNIKDRELKVNIFDMSGNLIYIFFSHLALRIRVVKLNCEYLFLFFLF